MERAGLADHEAPLAARGPGERRVAARVGRLRLLVEPARQHVAVVKRADRLLEPLPEVWRPAVLAPDGVLDLGRVAQAADATAQRMERLRQEAVPDAAEAAQQRRRLRLAERENPGQRDCGFGGPTLLQPAQAAAQAVDIEVQDRGAELPSAARPSGPQPAEERPLLEARGPERRQAILQEADDDLEVPRGAGGTRQPSQDPLRPAQPPGALAAHQQAQRDAQASRRDPQLVDRLRVPHEGARQLLEDTSRVRTQQRGGSILGKRVECHGKITART